MERDAKRANRQVLDSGTVLSKNGWFPATLWDVIYSSWRRLVFDSRSPEPGTGVYSRAPNDAAIQIEIDPADGIDIPSILHIVRR